MKYFKYFGKYDYSMYGEILNQTDITQFAEINKKISDNIGYYNYYSVLDGERPDHISFKLYGTPDYYWTIFLMNDNLKNFYKDWYKSSSVLDTYLKESYPYFVIEFENDISGKFSIGEEVISAINIHVIAEIVDINTNNYQLVVRNVQNRGVYMDFESDLEGLFTAESGVRGITSNGFAISTGFYKQYHATKYWCNDKGETVNPEYATQRVSIEDDAKEINDANGQIRVIQPQYIKSVISDFVEEMKK